MQGRNTKILVVEDERSMREVLTMLLEGEGYSVKIASSGSEGLDLINRDIYDLVITDIKMPGTSGFDILTRVKEVSKDTPVIMITAFGTMESTLKAMKEGAYDYIHKPFKVDEIRAIVRNAVDKRRLQTEVEVLREAARESSKITNIIGSSPSMQQLLIMIPKAASIMSNIMITGESGTGKELVASALHHLSPRRDRHFVALNCAAFPEGLLESELFGHVKGSFTGASSNKQGLFEIADGGTLFLDEIAEMPMELQSKLLRAIESGMFRRVGGTDNIKVNVRIISATNRNLKEEAEAGRFREDLYFRLNVVPLHIPPLRERKEDISLLVDHFIRKYSDRPRQFSGSALNMIMNCSWKGNVRELENLIERLMLMTDKDIITAQDLPPEYARIQASHAGTPSVESGIDLDNVLQELEKKYLLEALSLAKGKKTEAAKLLNLPYRSFRHKLAKYGIK